MPQLESAYLANYLTWVIRHPLLPVLDDNDLTKAVETLRQIDHSRMGSDAARSDRGTGHYRDALRVLVDGYIAARPATIESKIALLKEKVDGHNNGSFPTNETGVSPGEYADFVERNRPLSLKSGVALARFFVLPLRAFL